jgi:hypothetical protein
MERNYWGVPTIHLISYIYIAIISYFHGDLTSGGRRRQYDATDMIMPTPSQLRHGSLLPDLRLRYVSTTVVALGAHSSSNPPIRPLHLYCLVDP